MNRRWPNSLRGLVARQVRPWEGADIWIPTPRQVVGPEAAGVAWNELTMPSAFDRFTAPPLVICGSARSGTTWTLDLFERHPLVGTVCESWLLTQTDGLTALLTQPYWNPEIRRRWQERLDVPFGAVQLLTYREALKDLGDLLARWMVRACRPEHQFLVAKEPLDLEAAGVLFPTARFIHVVRDGRNVALSMRRASESWDPSMGVGQPMWLRAEAWKRQVDIVRRHRKWLGDRYLEIHYEDMVRAPRVAMKTLFDFGGIPYDDALLSEIDASTNLATYSDAVQASGFRGGGRGGDWRSQFSRADVIGFHRAATDLLVELGYESDRGWWRQAIRHSRRTS